MFLLFLDMPHIEVRFTEELGCLELIRLFQVHLLHSTGLRRREVTSRLSADPARGHIRNLGCRDEVIHLLVDGGRDTLVIDANALCGLFYLSEDV